MRSLVLIFFSAASAWAGPIWVLTWSDEFNAANNTGLDGTKWSYDLGGGGWGNGELETYTNSLNNVRHDGAGHLIIQANADYTSGRFQSSGKFAQAYGRMEAYIKIPYGQGMWPAFWMLGNNIGGVGWPTCGEVDIMENVGFEPDIVHGTIHGPGYSGAGGVGAPYNLGVPASNAYHLYAVEWEPNIIRWYVDNTLYEVRTPADVSGTWVYDHPFYLIFDFAVGGYWPGNPDGTTVFPQQMLIDYVRVYSRDSTQKPVSGSAIPIPGTVQAEDFDDGGEGVAYHDTEPTNLGGLTAPRSSEGVDLEACTDTGGGSDLGWTQAGEWLEYTVDVAAAGNFAFTARVASNGAGGGFHLNLDGVTLTGSTLTVPNTGGWATWADLGPVTLTLPAGQHVLRLAMDSVGASGGVGNFNWLKFTSLSTPTPTRTRTPTYTPTRTVTLTCTPTFTATRTLTPSRTPSPSPSSSPTPTASSTASPTETDVPPGSSLTDTPSISPTWSQSPTSTETLSATPSGTESPSATPTETSTATLTESPTVTASETSTVTPSVTATPTDTITFPSTFTSTDTATPTVTLTAMPAATAPPAVGGHGQVLQAVAFPQPASGPLLSLALRLDGPADDAELRLYTQAMTCVLKQRLAGPFHGGWDHASVDVSGLSSGLYFLRCGQAKSRLVLLK